MTPAVSPLAPRLGATRSHPPPDAIAAFIEAQGYEHHQLIDEIILSTLPPGMSRRLRQDLPHRLERRYQIRVTQVIGEPAEAPGSRPARWS